MKDTCFKNDSGVRVIGKMELVLHVTSCHFCGTKAAALTCKRLCFQSCSIDLQTFVFSKLLLSPNYCQVISHIFF